MKAQGGARNQKGQSTVEAVLLMFGIVLLVTFISNYFQQNNLLGQVVRGPWTYLAGMIEGGVWLPADRVKPYHPSQWERVRTIEPEGSL
jgi:hypothetical protein